MERIKSRVGNGFLIIHKWNDGKVSIEIKPHKGDIDCESARNSVGLAKKDVERLINSLICSLSDA